MRGFKPQLIQSVNAKNTRMIINLSQNKLIKHIQGTRKKQSMEEINMGARSTLI